MWYYVIVCTHFVVLTKRQLNKVFYFWNCRYLYYTYLSFIPFHNIVFMFGWLTVYVMYLLIFSCNLNTLHLSDWFTAKYASSLLRTVVHVYYYNNMCAYLASVHHDCITYVQYLFYVLIRNYVHTYFNCNVALNVFSLFARVIWVFLDYLMSLYPSRWVKFGHLASGKWRCL